MCTKQSKDATVIPSMGKSLDEACSMAELESPVMKECPSLDPEQPGNCECEAGGELGSMMERVGVRAIMRGNNIN